MDKRIEAARTIIETEYHKPLWVPELAKRVGLSRSHMEFLFKKETGITFKAYLRGVRLDRDSLIEFLKSLQVLPPGARSLCADQTGRDIDCPPAIRP